MGCVPVAENHPLAVRLCRSTPLYCGSRTRGRSGGRRAWWFHRIRPTLNGNKFAQRLTVSALSLDTFTDAAAVNHDSDCNTYFYLIYRRYMRIHLVAKSYKKTASSHKSNIAAISMVMLDLFYRHHQRHLHVHLDDDYVTASPM